jgi:hypothetical protein
MLISFDAHPLVRIDGQTPAGVLKEFIQRSKFESRYAKLETSDLIMPCDQNLFQLSQEVSEPQRLVNKFRRLDYVKEFEWDDSISLLHEADLGDLRSQSYLQVPMSLLHGPASQVPQTLGHAQELRRSSELGPRSDKKLRTYDRMRKRIFKRTNK